jgi:hypothetical protein
MTRLLAIAALTAAAACSPPAQAPEETPIPIETASPVAEAPAEVLAVIRAEEPGFTPSDVIQDNTTGAQTYEVRGTGDGARTYHVMHFNEGWRIVQIRRDLAWGDAPVSVRNAVATSPQAIVPDRVVELREPGADGVMYELYAGAAQTPALTVREVGGEAAIMPAPH